MNNLIVTAPAGAGKTSAVIQQILETEQIGFGQEVWVLLPSNLQIESFRERLLQAADLGAIFNIRLFSFYELYDHLLDLAGSPQRILPRSASDRILKQVIHELNNSKQLLYYNQIAGKAGFIKLVSEWIEELKQGLVEFNAFWSASRSEPRNYKTHDLALIYETYQLFLNQHDLADKEGAGWVALNAVRDDPSLVGHVALLAVDGYDQFTPLQSQLLAALGQGVQQSIVTLTYEESRKHDVCRLFARTLDRLHQDGAWDEAFLESPADHRPAPLAHLERQLFTLHSTAISADGHLHLIEAPDAYEEVRAVMRQIKRDLLAGVLPDEMLIILRQADPYADAVRQTAAAYQIPVLMRQAEKVLDNPAVAAVLALIDLHQQDFPYRRMMDVLWSAYLYLPDLSQDDVVALEKIGMARQVVQGRDDWLAAVKASTALIDEEGETIATDAPIGLADRVQAFFDRLTPPASGIADDYAAWLENLIGDDPAYHQEQRVDGLAEVPATAPDHCNVFGCVRDSGDPQVVVRDLVALREFYRAVDDVLAAHDLLFSIHQQHEQIGWESFRADLELALQRRTVDLDRDGSRRGRILVTSAFEARGLHHDYVYLPGLAEGIFPEQQNESPLYSDRERRELINRYQLAIQNPEERARDMGLFYEMCVLANQHLTLARPTIDSGGNEWAASIYWKTTIALLTVDEAQKLRIAPGSVPPIQTAASPREAAVSLSHLLSQSSISPDEWAYLNWFRAHPVGAHVQHGRAIEQARNDPRQPFDRYSGILSQPDLIQQVGEKLGDSYIWSATQFNALGSCGFRFFSERLLKLEPYEDPEEGMNVLQLGTLNHAILETTYQIFEKRGITLHPDYRDTAMEILEAVAAEKFATAPDDYEFRVTPLWKQEQRHMLNKLRLLVAIDFSLDDNPFSTSENRRPFWQEARFGDDGQTRIDLPDLPDVRVRGAIDRMDLIDERMIIIADYKSGTPPTQKDAVEGRNFQMMLYLMAARQIIQRQQLPYQLEGGLFWSIRRPDDNRDGIVGPLTLDELQDAQFKLAAAIKAARAGQFPTLPEKIEEDKCTKYCDFSQLCRVRQSYRSKPVPTDAADAGYG